LSAILGVADVATDAAGAITDVIFPIRRDAEGG
jgi:hypothetical protein